MSNIIVEHPDSSSAGRIRSVLGQLRLSIRYKILLALLSVLCLMSIPYVFLIVPGLQYKHQYDAIIQNITAANSISGSMKHAIDTEMWDIAAGKRPFSQGDQYRILDDVSSRVQQMIDNTDSLQGKIKLMVIQRTISTLRELVDQVGVQIAERRTFDENEPVIECIREVSQLVENNVQEYTLFEVKRTEQQYHAMQTNLTRWAIAGMGAIVAALLFSIAAAWRISQGIYVPIKKLHDITRTIARHDLEVLMTSANVDEITELGMSFNSMVVRIRELLASKIKEQENLKKAELRALQAQINPHFLYNTLDTIIWMAEANRTAQVVDLVRVLSRFFRITLSKGKDWITVREEFDHVESYLAIQKIRYRDILDYRIELPPDTFGGSILKLTLQPLVENALYHGIKNKRSGGVIVVRGQRIDGDRLQIEIDDNGIGIAPEPLARLRTVLECAVAGDSASESGYGLHNVNQRIKLYYGQEYGLSIESEYQHGTRVTVTLPFQTQPERQ